MMAKTRVIFLFHCPPNARRANRQRKQSSSYSTVHPTPGGPIDRGNSHLPIPLSTQRPAGPSTEETVIFLFHCPPNARRAHRQRKQSSSYSTVHPTPGGPIDRGNSHLPIPLSTQRPAGPSTEETVIFLFHCPPNARRAHRQRKQSSSYSTVHPTPGGPIDRGNSHLPIPLSTQRPAGQSTEETGRRANRQRKQSSSYSTVHPTPGGPIDRGNSHLPIPLSTQRPAGQSTEETGRRANRQRKQSSSYSTVHPTPGGPIDRGNRRCVVSARPCPAPLP
ncbi:hypothetical protein ACOMHN_020009 [Nucella lapillus]